MADLGLQLLTEIADVLARECPLEGGWHATRLATPNFPVGYIDLTDSEPQRGQCHYAERHSGVITVWTRASKDRAANPAEAYRLSELAHRKLGEAVLSTPLMRVASFEAGTLRPLNPGGLDWGRAFTFTALTYEV